MFEHEETKKGSFFPSPQSHRDTEFNPITRKSLCLRVSVVVILRIFVFY